MPHDRQNQATRSLFGRSDEEMKISDFGFQISDWTMADRQTTDFTNARMKLQTDNGTLITTD